MKNKIYFKINIASTAKVVSSLAASTTPLETWNSNPPWVSSEISGEMEVRFRKEGERNG